MLISQERLSTSLSRSEHRLAMARNRKRRQARLALALALLFLAIASLYTAARVAANAPPPAPRLTVAWPARELGSCVVPSGATLLARSEQPLFVSVENASDWNLSVRDGAATINEERVRWTPNGAGELVLGCRPAPVGWRVLGTPFLPTYTLRLKSLRAERLEDGRLRLPEGKASALSSALAPPGPTALASARVRALAGVAWDERALPLLESAASEVSSSTPVLPGEPRWVLTRSFDSDRARQDGATYAVLNDVHPPGGSNAETLARLARVMARLEPTTNLKCVAGGTSTSDVTLSVVRLAFDNTGARDGWRKQPGQKNGAQWRWWQDSNGQNGNEKREKRNEEQKH